MNNQKHFSAACLPGLRCPEPVEGSLSKGACRREPAEVQSVSLHFFKPKQQVIKKPFNGHLRSYSVNTAEYRYLSIEKLAVSLPNSGTFPFTDVQTPIMLVQAPKTIGQRLKWVSKCSYDCCNG
ncbi:MAG: hypothetical protein PF694_09750 [Bacteroidetes bacterium]|nr:hypothetical protein [Bacteroidota bacterium]